MNARQILGFCGFAALGYAFCEPFRLRVREWDVSLPDLPASAHGTRVLQISDIHAGMYLSRVLLRKIVALANAQNADLVVLTGDMVSRRNAYHPPFVRPLARPVTDYAQDLARELEILKPKLGMFAVAGNHDVWESDFGPIAGILARAGVQNLNNRAVILSNGLPLLGLDDLRGGFPDLSVLKSVEKTAAQLVLSHNPRLALALSGRNALVLSGHTHGGQVALPAPFGRTPVDAQSSHFKRGFYRVGAAQLYVCSGVGSIAIPVRFGVLPELAVFTLRRSGNF